jgi:predicted nucleic acid-binding protein
VAGDPPEDVAVPADASVLIGLSALNQLSLLGNLFDRVYVCPAVWDEVVLRGSGRPGAEQIANAPFIERRSVRDRKAADLLRTFLGAGEAETLALAQELACPLVLLDELRARKAAERAGIRAVGVVGLLLEARRRGLIARVAPLLAELQARGFRLAPSLVAAALEDVGESDAMG